MKTPEEYVKDYFGEIVDGYNNRGERISQYDVCKVIGYAMHEYGKQQYNQGVKDAAENVEISIVDIGGHLVPDGSIDKDSILKLLKP